jgi:hypothetical protein
MKIVNHWCSRTKTLVYTIAFFFLCSSAFALPKATYSGSQTTEDEKQESSKSLKELDVVVTPAPEGNYSEPVQQTRYLFKHNLALRSGIFLNLNDSAEAQGSIGIQYLVPNNQRDERMVTNWEASVDMLFGGSPFLSVLKKWTYQPKEVFRYTFRAGGALSWVAKEQLAAFVNYKNYAAQGSAGIEYWLYKGISLKAEADGFVGLEILSMGFTVGGVFAW